MPMTAAESYALGTKQGRDRINQQLRANPQYTSYLQSIGVSPGGQLSDQQRTQAADWVRQNQGGIGGLEIDAAGNLNNPRGFGQVVKQWGPVAAAVGGIAAPYILPALFGGSGGAVPAGALTGGATGSTVPVTGALAGEIAATTAPLGAVPITAGPVATAAAGGGGMGWGSILPWLKKAGNVSDLIGAGGDLLKGSSDASAANRGTKLEAQMDMERLLMERDQDYLTRQILREREGRESGTDAWQRLLRAQHVLSPTARPNADNPYASPQRVANPTERAAADAMTLEVMKRLQGGNPITPQTQRPINVDMGLTDPSGWERFAGLAGQGMRGYGAYRLLRDLNPAPTRT